MKAIKAAATLISRPICHIQYRRSSDIGNEYSDHIRDLSIFIHKCRYIFRQLIQCRAAKNDIENPI